MNCSICGRNDKTFIDIRDMICKSCYHTKHTADSIQTIIDEFKNTETNETYSGAIVYSPIVKSNYTVQLLNDEEMLALYPAVKIIDEKELSALYLDAKIVKDV